MEPNAEELLAKLEELDAEFNAPDSTMHLAVWKERRAQLVAQIEKPSTRAPESPPPMTFAQLEAEIANRFDWLEERIPVLWSRIKALHGRLAKLESQAGSGVHIHADDVRVDGLGELGAAVAKLDRTLGAPVVARYEKGRLVSARRDLSAGEGDTVSPLEARVAMVEHHLATKPHYKLVHGQAVEVIK